ncbi:carbohydrate ABC transporter permease [Nocardiopsis valliformis]|uniref:carbohydrate ABC transporter permease n=1 Tax=Nocardiopsis valliformis TaxID=239974 RepID=UPI000344ABB0|nr:sugar ABC transporter permease [Nocardiopsis valliformis]
MAVADAPPDIPAQTRSTPRKRTRRGRVQSGQAVPWWFLLPALAFFAFVVLVPSLQGAWFAFTDWDGIARERTFVGLEQFREILDGRGSRTAVGNTLIIALSVTVVQNVIGLLLALGLHSAVRSRNILRVFFFAPAVITPVVAAYLWRYLYAPRGAINAVLDAVGLGFLQQDWLGNSSIALWSVVAVIIWQFAGLSMVIFLAGLQTIPKELHEAAAVDGAGPVRRFWNVTRPMLAPAITINLMLSVIGGLKLFDQVWVMTGGGPGGATDTLSTVIYRQAFQFNQFAYSTALALVLTGFVIVLSAVQYGYLRREERKAS